VSAIRDRDPSARTPSVDRSLVRLRVRPGTTYVSNGRSVLATDDNGVLAPELDRGLFVDETRLLSRYRYLIDGVAPQPVSSSNVSQHSWLGYFIALAAGGNTRIEWRLQRTADTATQTAF